VIGVELISLKKMSKETKLSILKELGYDSDGTFIFKAGGLQLMDPYIREPIKVDNMLILPGSTIILDNNPLSVASYFEDHGDIL
jgi:hypothetical protein